MNTIEELRYIQAECERLHNRVRHIAVETQAEKNLRQLIVSYFETANLTAEIWIQDKDGGRE